MTQARDIYGNVFARGCVTLLARIVGNDANVLTGAAVSSVKYTIFLLDTNDPGKGIPVRGYRDVDISPEKIVFDELQTEDPRWDVDDQGYNFRHTLMNDNGKIFTAVNRHYLVEYRLTPRGGNAVVTLRFRLFVI